MNPSESVNRPQEIPGTSQSEKLTGVAGTESGHETAPKSETFHGGPMDDPVSLIAPTTSQLPPVTASDSSQPAVITDDNPLLAADEEVIEQEWVKKAKDIVAKTKGDPYTQEKEVGKLQADYLKKRYGKEIKLTSD